MHKGTNKSTIISTMTDVILQHEKGPIKEVYLISDDFPSDFSSTFTLEMPNNELDHYHKLTLKQIAFENLHLTGGTTVPPVVGVRIRDTGGQTFFESIHKADGNVKNQIYFPINPLHMSLTNQLVEFNPPLIVSQPDMDDRVGKQKPLPNTVHLDLSTPFGVTPAVAQRVHLFLRATWKP